MSVINNTTYFLGPLYTNSIISTGNISIINDVSCVGIITKDISCNNISTKNISFVGNININSNSLSLNIPITYISNVSSTVDITYADMGINRNNNISNTLGYTFNVKNEASTNTDAYLPFLGVYTTIPINYFITSTSNLTIGSIKVTTPGMYLLYITFGVFSSNTTNYTTSYSIFNFNTEVKINDTSILIINEMNNIQNYRSSVSEYSNVLNFYNKIVMCNVTDSNSVITMIYKPAASDTTGIDCNGTIDTTFSFHRTLRYNIIKIS